MYFTLVTYLIVGLQVILPLWLIYGLWTSEFSSRASWLVRSLHATAILVTLFIIGRWDVVGFYNRMPLYGLYGILIWASFAGVRELPFRLERGRGWSWGPVMEMGLLGALLAWMAVGAPSEREILEIASPLKGPRVYVLQGGGTPVTNYHGLFADPQAWAMDLNRLGDRGFRASGLYPAELERYEVFGDTVYGPLNGQVVEAVDSFPDQRPPRTLREAPVGNHIWIRQDSLYLVLAHLKHGSVHVRAGDSVDAGQPLARVGNTGNTQEPHLHVHAVVPASGSPLPDDSIPIGGRAVPLGFGHGVPLRNALIDGGAGMDGSTAQMSAPQSMGVDQ